MIIRRVYLLTTGDGSDGNEWNVERICSTKKKVVSAKRKYERKIFRKDGSYYRRDSKIEIWDVD